MRLRLSLRVRSPPPSYLPSPPFLPSLPNLKLTHLAVDLSSATDITNLEQNKSYEGQITASRQRLDVISSKRSRHDENEIIEQMSEIYLPSIDLITLFRPLPTINLKKRQKHASNHNTDPMFDSIADSVVVLPDNWHTLNSRKSTTTQTNITKSKKQQQEKGSNYNDRMKSKVAAKKVKNEKKSKQKHL